MKKRHVIIVGGGASGMVAAISAAREGAKVTIIEHQNKLGKKILSTGNGKCNLTNEYMVAECFRGEDLSIVDTVLKKFGYKETVSFFESLGVLTKSRQGYIYPVSEQASAVLDVLVMELEKLSVDVILNEHCRAEDSLPQRRRSCNFRFTKKRAIYSCGGKQKILCGCGNFGDRW